MINQKYFEIKVNISSNKFVGLVWFVVKICKVFVVTAYYEKAVIDTFDPTPTSHVFLTEQNLTDHHNILLCVSLCVFRQHLNTNSGTLEH